MTPPQVLDKPLSINDLAAMKQRGEAISCLTAYDASFAAMLDQAGIDVLLVGDSLGMCVQGHSTTLPVTVADTVYHTQCVARAKRRAWLIADMPFMTSPNKKTAAENAAKLLQEGGAQMIKLEGAKPAIVEFLVTQGVPVCGHLGLLPQFVNQLGGYRVQGRLASEAERILADALHLQQTGAKLLILECVPAALAETISKELVIPVIGIGAGFACDGQILVLYDILGISSRKPPRFVKNFMTEANSIRDAVATYHQAVKQRQFPGKEHSY